MKVFIGVDPHKLSATIEVVDDRETVLATGRFFESMELAADPGLTFTALSAPAGSPDDDALQLLASWAATHHPADSLATPETA